MRNGKKSPSPERGHPRPKVRRTLKRRMTVLLLAAGILALSGGGGFVLWQNGTLDRAARHARAAWIAGTAGIGFRVDEVLVVGRNETPQADFLAALALERGSPLFAFDAGEARRRVEALPWVRRATVTRMLPATVVLKVEEREPLALWQHQGRFALIDRAGHVILREGLERFNRLPVVVGEDAPPHAADMLAILETEPQLMSHVTALVRVGGRRWNIRMDGVIDVQLPEDNAAQAWKRLAEYERTQSVLSRDVRVLDMRMPDRLIVRTRTSDKQT